MSLNYIHFNTKWIYFFFWNIYVIWRKKFETWTKSSFFKHFIAIYRKEIHWWINKRNLNHSEKSFVTRCEINVNVRFLSKQSYIFLESCRIYFVICIKAVWIQSMYVSLKCFTFESVKKLNLFLNVQFIQKICMRCIWREKFHNFSLHHSCHKTLFTIIILI